MAFLDNSGDIILDAVLTDTGRKRLARGDGSFRIANYAFGDDEVNYALYNPQHPSGSAYYDLEIMKTPVLEAFTNNMSSMKSKLISIARTNLLYLPILKVNNGLDNSDQHFFARGTAGGNSAGKDLFVVAVDQETEYVFTNQFGSSGAPGTTNQDYNINNIHFDGKGIMSGRGTSGALRALVRIDQGLDTEDIPPTFGIDSDLAENQYIIEMDNRLGYLTAIGNSIPSTPNYIDDDDIATYLISDADVGFITENDSQELLASNSEQVIAGPRGTILQFRMKSSIELQSSTFLFQRLGTTVSDISGGNSVEGMGFKHHFIDTNVRVTGVTTGYTVDIPVRFVKYDTDI